MDDENTATNFIDEAAVRRAAEKIVDEPSPSVVRFVTFDLRKWKIDRFAEIIASEMKGKESNELAL